MLTQTILASLSAAALVLVPGEPPERGFENGVFTSERLPRIRMRVDPAFAYIGNVTFELKNIALVDRHVFVDADGERINRMIVLQFEGFLDDNDHTYVWDITNPISLGEHEYKHNTFFFDTSKAMEENPGAETDHTVDFLEREGVPQLASEQMVSRFARVVDAARHHELIIFYHENVRDSGHSLGEISEDGGVLPQHAAIAEALTERSLSSLSVLDD